MAHKKTVAVFFGGASSEHEVSLVSASSIIENIPRDKYDVILVGITKTGRWLCFDGNVGSVKDGSWEKHPGNRDAFISMNPEKPGLCITENSTVKIIHIDAAFPVLHGKNGEDGTIQGLFALAGIPFVGCSVTASAVCMDKILTNSVLDAVNIKQAKWFGFTSFDYNCGAEAILSKIESDLGYPCFVKPANAGSSVGVGKAKNRSQLTECIKTAAEHDKRILLEEAIDGIEVECSVLGNDEPIASVVGEITPANEFYDYAAKYSSPDSILTIPAKIAEETSLKIREIAVNAYKALSCEGLSRVDFFVEKTTGEVLLNELNTMPGFTSISMYPKLFEKSGIPYPELLDRLITLAVKRSGCIDG